MMANVAVFLSSSELVSPVFLDAAGEVGRKLALARHTLIYGGANCGMMGRLAADCKNAGGKVVGVIPDLDFVRDLDFKNLDEKIVVKSMAERKHKMLDRADVVLALPGGLGTLDEVLDALVLKVAGELKKPIFFLNTLEYWDPFLEALTLMCEQRMINQPLESLFEVAATMEDFLLRWSRQGVQF